MHTPRGYQGGRRSLRHFGTRLLQGALVSLSTTPVALAMDDAVGGLEQVVVTAQKRTERLIDVPISVSSFSAESIARTGVQQLREVANYVPNVQIVGLTNAHSRLNIRGVGSFSRHIGFDTRVGVYVDGVYLGQSPALNQDLLDLERIEVLRGPQGTLFGKNTVAGAINLISRKPGDELEGRVAARIGNFNAQQYSGQINMPLSERVALKLMTTKIDRDGYVRNLATGSDLEELDDLAYRAQLRVEVTPDLEANLSLDGLNGDRLVSLGEPITNSNGTALNTDSPKPMEVRFDTDPREERDAYGAALTLDYSLPGDFALKSISAYRDTHSRYVNDLDYSPAADVVTDFTDDYRQLTQELQLISPGGRTLEYLFGLYYYDQRGDSRRDAINGGAVRGAPGDLGFTDGIVDTLSYAAFVNGKWTLTERFNIGFGLRYSYETKEVDWTARPMPPGSRFAAYLNARFLDELSYEDLSPSLSLSFAPSDYLNMYARYSSGYKSGGWNLDFLPSSIVAGVPPAQVPEALKERIGFDKETVDSFEIGIKGELFDHRMTLALAAFLSRYDDFQIRQVVQTAPGIFTFSITNAAEVETRGIEAEVTLQPVSGLTLQGAVGLLEATFESFVDARGIDRTGNDLDFAPKYNYSVNAQYNHSLPSLDGQLLVRADLARTGPMYTTDDNVKQRVLASGDVVPFGYLQARTNVSARLGFISDHGWEAYLWGRNLTDDDTPVEDLQGFVGATIIKSSEPRTYGIEVSWTF